MIDALPKAPDLGKNNGDTDSKKWKWRDKGAHRSPVYLTQSYQRKVRLLRRAGSKGT